MPLKIRVFIQGSCFKGSIVRMLVEEPRFEFIQSKTIEDSDMVLYTGGADVGTHLYGEPPMRGTAMSHGQDQSDKAAYKEAVARGLFQVGICRGAQFLNVMNGGKMWQDISNHGYGHDVKDVDTGKVYEVSSLHHQGIILPQSKAKLLAWCEVADKKVAARASWSKVTNTNSIDVEAFWISDTRCLGVQWHPEIGPQSCVDWFFDYIQKYYTPLEKEAA
jgi:gamma-glutamyl-gamma-aminobutyrate hydrolase PuuD